MSMLHQEQQSEQESTYDSQTLQKVIALASRMQQEQEETPGTLTALQIEAMGAEVGLDPAIVQKALQQIATEESKMALRTARRKGLWSRENRPQVAAVTIPLLWA